MKRSSFYSESDLRRRTRQHPGLPFGRTITREMTYDGLSPLHEDRFYAPNRRRAGTMQSSFSYAPTFRSVHSYKPSAKESGLGGFPGPFRLLSSLFHHLLSRSNRIQLTRTTTHSSFPYVSFDAIIGHNSAFHMLTEDEMEELGGVEYRALNALLWIVGAVSSHDELYSDSC